MKKIGFFRLMVVISIIIAMCSCGKSVEEKILGRWDKTEESSFGSTFSFEFFDDGTYIMYENRTNGEEKVRWEGDWKITDNSKLRLTDPGAGGGLFDFSVEGNKLNINAGEGKFITGVYVKE